jgi:hypothetical protein
VASSRLSGRPPGASALSSSSESAPPRRRFGGSIPQTADMAACQSALKAARSRTFNGPGAATTAKLA